MLFSLTLIVDFCAMSIALWLGFYLLGRGFLHPLTMRAVIVLLALSAFFFGAYNNLFIQIEGTAAWRAILLIVGLATWYNLTCLLITPENRRHRRWLEIVVYVLGGLTAILLLVTKDAFVQEQGNVLFVAHMGVGFQYTVYGIYLISISIAIIYNLLSGEKIGLTSRGKYFLLASIFPILEVGYGTFGLISPHPMPRLIQDFLMFCGVFLIGIAVARHQELISRRITQSDFPISAIVILGLSGLYAYLSWRWGLELRLVGFVMMFAIFTHSGYDLAREFLERRRISFDIHFRQKLRDLDSKGLSDENLRLRLKMSLGLLCQTLRASGGFIATRQGETYTVAASHRSISIGTRIEPEIAVSDDLSQLQTEFLPNVAWLAPIIENNEQLGVLGINEPSARIEYSSDELDLLAEVADRLGSLIMLSNIQGLQIGASQQSSDMMRGNSAQLNSSTDALMQALTENPGADFVKNVEDGLRHLTDYITLGQSPLAEWMGIQEDSQIERGKTLHHILMEAIESLRPGETRPKEPLPRIWYSYAVLHDAYVEDVPNREIMARLYISEGTFNRTRRNALRGLARFLLEKNRAKF